MARAESAAIFYDLGVEQAPFSTLISYLIRVLLVLTDNVGRRGGNVFFETLLPPVKDSSRKRDPERALASGIPAIAALGNFAMFSPTLVPEEVLLDHPERLRALVVEGSNPFLSFSDTARWREARERLDLLVVIEPAMTETAAVADYVLPTPVGYEKWEFANFPKGYPRDLRAAAAADRSGTGRCAARAGDLRATGRGDGPVRRAAGRARRARAAGARRRRRRGVLGGRAAARRGRAAHSPRSACCSGATARSASTCPLRRSQRSGCSRT